MKIILYEMKKIWNWKIMGVLVIITALFYYMFLYYPIEFFEENHPGIEEHDFAVEMVERYGISITEEELESFVAEKMPVYEAELDTYFETLPVLETAGISTYEDYQLLHEKEALTEAELDGMWAMQGEETNYVLYKIQTLNNLAHELSVAEGSNDILPDYTFRMTMDYIGQLAILIVLLSFILVSPLIVNDRTRNIHFLQYTSKNGRKIFKQQLIAGLLSTFLLTTLWLVIFGGMILRNDLLVFWNSAVHSFLNVGMRDALYHLSFSEYLTISVLLIYLLSMGVACLAFVLSRYSRNLITLIMKVIPIFAIFVIVCTFMYERMFNLYNRFYQLTNIMGIEGMVPAVLLSLTIVLSVFVLKREKRIDVF